jgi:hypothetical protein
MSGIAVSFSPNDVFYSNLLKMAAKNSCFGCCSKILLFLSLSIHLTCCSDTSPDHSMMPELQVDSTNQPMSNLHKDRVSNQDLNKSFIRDTDRQIFATPLLPYPDDLNFTKQSD